MTEAELYLRLGFAHITDLQGYDHMLFLLALVAAYTLADWRRVLVMVTAFTLGHSLTLALTALEVIHVGAAWIEFLIPLTILLTALGNFLPQQEGRRRGWALRYGLALGFGLIHGLGFSNYFRSLLGNASAVIQPLLYFNCGIELGQLLIVTALLGMCYLLVNLIGLPARWWRVGLSVVAGVLALVMLIGRWPF
jgi:hypothetical protein